MKTFSSLQFLDHTNFFSSTMVAPMPIIAGGICGLILLCIGGCCLCGFCSIMRNSKKKAAELKSKKKKRKQKSGQKNGSVVGSEGSQVQAVKQ